jgi:hypothetical protein
MQFKTHQKKATYTIAISADAQGRRLPMYRKNSGVAASRSKEHSSSPPSVCAHLDLGANLPTMSQMTLAAKSACRPPHYNTCIGVSA